MLMMFNSDVHLNRKCFSGASMELKDKRGVSNNRLMRVQGGNITVGILNDRITIADYSAVVASEIISRFCSVIKALVGYSVALASLRSDWLLQLAVMPSQS